MSIGDCEHRNFYTDPSGDKWTVCGLVYDDCDTRSDCCFPEEWQPIIYALPDASEEQIEAATLALKQPDTQKVDAAREILSIESGQWTADIKFYLPARDEWMDCEYYGKKREKGSE